MTEDTRWRRYDTEPPPPVGLGSSLDLQVSDGKTVVRVSYSVRRWNAATGELWYGLAAVEPLVVADIPIEWVRWWRLYPCAPPAEAPSVDERAAVEQDNGRWYVRLDGRRIQRIHFDTAIDAWRYRRGLVEELKDLPR